MWGVHNDIKEIINCASMQCNVSIYFVFLCSVISLLLIQFFSSQFISAVNEHEVIFAVSEKVHHLRIC